VWGRNNYGPLGKGSPSVSERTPLKLNLGKINSVDVVAKSVAAGFSHSLILTTDGKVFGFGRNNSGQTGQSATSSVVLVPTLISGLSGIRSIAAGTDSSFAIAESGQLYSWGYNSYGELLLGYASPAVYGPTQSPICRNVFNVSGGGYSSLAVIGMLTESPTLQGYGIAARCFPQEASAMIPDDRMGKVITWLSFNKDFY
jgi:alpha-tubulin suppressor-like RCC1 family protein